MKFGNVVIDSFGYAKPEEFISSEELELRLLPVYQRLKLPEGRLEMQTGIKSRGVWPIGTRPSSIATTAAKNLIENNNIQTDDIDMLMFTSVCRDFLEPASASVVHHNLKLPQTCENFDLSNACLGVMQGMSIAATMIEQGYKKKVLIVSGENSGPLLEQTISFLNHDLNLTRKSIKKYVANLTIGSAGVALLLTHKDLSESSHHLLGAQALADTSTNHLCQGSGSTESLMMETQSEELLHAGVKLAKQNFELMLKEFKWSRSDFHKVITHQVGSAHNKLLFETLDINKPSYSTYEEYGNTGSAALPLTLMRAHEEYFLVKDDLVSLLGIGSGLNTIMMGVKW